MDNRVIAMAVLAVVILGAGFIMIKPEENTPLVEDETRVSPEGGPSEGFDPESFGQRGGGSFGLEALIQALANASAEPEEYLELIVNMTENFESFYNESEEAFRERMAPMLEFYQELEDEVRGLVDQGSTAEEVQGLISDRLEELVELRPERPGTG